MNILKIAANSNPSAAAGALANTIREFGVAEMQAIGPKAVNQAVKCIAIARGYMAPSGVDLFFVPSFTDVEINGETKTALRFTVRSRTPVTSLRPRTRGGGAAAAEG
ncbi:MAG TPA: stage V sporulation protein S [Candidatus Acetothermia bacterium]|nr:stage V sporulation protein S [Candidatus Bipolaricaulota bacterium]HDI11888.1 stage V sporulation protein S [Candidatus Acetothermia bacterium]